MNTQEISPVGQDVLTHTGAVVVGLSLENSYFNYENIKSICAWAQERKLAIYVMIPDEPAIHTYMACELSREKATQKARLKANNLENKCLRVSKELGIQVAVIRWKSVRTRDKYRKTLSHLQDLLAINEKFKLDAQKTTRMVLEGKNIKVSEASLELGIQFLLEELAFISNAHHFTGDKSMYLYHKPTPVLKNLLAGKYGEENLEVGYIVLTQ